MALLTAQQTVPLPRTAKRDGSRLITRGKNALQKRTSERANHSVRYQADQQSQNSCCTLESSLYHRGWVCGASLLLLTVTIRGMAKVHTMREAGNAVWALMGAFLLAGW